MDRQNQIVNSEAQLANIRKMIRFTRDNLSKLNERFADIQHPPQMYINEYEHLTTKLNEFQNQEQRLMDQLSEENSSDQDDDQENHYDSHNSGLQYSPIDHRQHQEFDFDNLPRGGINNFSNLNDLTSSSMIASSNNTPTPKSPFKSTVRAHLPNHQRTIVQAKSGVSIKEALGKAMSRRGLTPGMCDIQVLNQNRKVDWNDNISDYENLEIQVTIKERFPFITSISHNYVRKTFFKISFCDVCQNLLLQGFRCQTCSFKFHRGCANQVPSLCEPLRFHSANYQDLLYGHILAMGNDYENNNDQSSNDHQHLNPKTRSTSEPSVFKVNQNQIDPVLEEHFNSPHSAGYTPYPNNRTNYPNQVPIASAAIGLQNINVRTHSAGGSPTSSFAINNNQVNTEQLNSQTRPRAKSADESSNKKLMVNQKCSSCTTYDSNCQQCLNATKAANNRVIIGEDWEIKKDEILTGPKIGSGSFGTVFKGLWHGPVALKKLNVKNPSPKQFQAFKNEVAVLKKTRHVNILLFMGCVSKDNDLMIVTQWCEGSSLFKHLHVLENKFELRQCMDISKQIAQGMDYLHSKAILHRDLKTQNIFLHEDLTVKIGDFGLATVKARWHGPHQFNHPTGSILWMAPEVIKMKDADSFTFKSDIYAYGIVLYEIFAQQLPYRKGDKNSLGNLFENQLVLYLVAQGKLTPDLSKCRKDTPKLMLKLIGDCVKFNKDDRPLFRKVLSIIESLTKSIPKISRSFSEPALNLNQTDIWEFGLASPTTPISHSQFHTHFQFYH